MAAANVPIKAKGKKQPRARLNKCVWCVSAWNMPKLPLSAHMKPVLHQRLACQTIYSAVTKLWL